VSKDSTETKAKMVTIREGLHELNEQIMAAWPGKLIHPLNWFSPLTQTLHNTTEFQLTVKDNCDAIREVIDDYIQDRKEGKNKSHVEGDTDLLTLFLSEPEVFSDEFIIDELIDFF
jgi:hypothetical protein